MKKFLIKVLLFIFIPFLIYYWAFVLFKVMYSKEVESCPIVILGDSQTKFIKHPMVFNNSINGSPYFVHFEFAKVFADQLKGKKVYIACNYHNFSKLYQNRLLNDMLYPGWRSTMFKRLDEYYFFNCKHTEVRPNGLEYNLFDIKKLPNLFQKVYLEKEIHNTSYSVNVDTMLIKDDINRHWYNSGYVSEDSIQTVFIEKLISLLMKLNCEVVLLKMPLTSYYDNSVPSDIKLKLSEISNKFNIRLLDLNNELSISREYKYFKDYGHLNIFGDTLIFNYFTKNEFSVLADTK